MPMVFFSLTFALGVWLLQQQAALPDMRWAGLLFLIFAILRLPHLAVWQRISHQIFLFAFALLCGFFYKPPLLPNKPSVAVLPYPSESDNWWIALLHHEPRLHIVGRLPFWRPRPDGAPAAQAIVVASTAPDASGDDRSFLGMECDSDVSRARLSGELTTAGLKPETMVLGRQQGSPIANVLVEVDGYLADDDARLLRLGAVLRRPIVLGSYAVPIGGAAR